VRQTDDTYVISPFESVNTGSSVWADNRHRAYWNSSTIANGFLLFDVSGIPDGSNIISMTLRCYLENAYGSPSNNPVVDIYYSGDDGWTRYTVSPTSLSHDILLVDDVPFTNYVSYFDFTLDVSAHNWSVDLIDDQICLGFMNDVTHYSYVYFYGAYGSPVGPAPELTIVTGTGPANMTVVLDYISGSPIPPGGGQLLFDVLIQNNETFPVNFDLWIEIPPQVTPPSVPNRNLTFPGGFAIIRPGQQWIIPGFWPSGNYEMIWLVGNLATQNAWASDSFPFVKNADDGGSYTLWEADSDPLESFFEGTEFDDAVVSEFALMGNYPNPFNPTTTINYTLDRANHVKLAVYDLSGREVATLVDGYRNSGVHGVNFDASSLASGLYIYRLTSGTNIASGKMVLMK
jgi:hypothetical protein